MIFVRVLLFPVVVIYLMVMGIGGALAWLLDSTYDHDAATKAYGITTGWIDHDEFFPERPKKRTRP